MGEHAVQWAQAVIRGRGIEGIRTVMGLLSLADKHAPDDIDQACRIAAGYGAFRLKNVRKLRASQAPQQEQCEFTQKHPIIRPLNVYVAIVVRTTDKIHGGAGNDTILGTLGADYIDGSGDDDIRGSAGNDILVGKVGHDTIHGGGGGDLIRGGRGIRRAAGRCRQRLPGRWRRHRRHVRRPRRRQDYALDGYFDFIFADDEDGIEKDPFDLVL